MGGILGRLLHEFAVTIGAAMLVSGFVSLSLTPMMCSRLLRPPAESHHGRIYNWSERMFEGLLKGYDWSLQKVIRHRLATMGVSIAIIVATVYLFGVMPKGFLPSEDRGLIFAFTEAAQGISYDGMVRHQLAVSEVVRQDPAVDAFMTSVGGGGPAGGANNSGVVFMTLKPRGQRPQVDQIINELRPKLAKVPGINTYLQNLPPIRIGGTLTKSQYQYTLQSPDLTE